MCHVAGVFETEDEAADAERDDTGIVCRGGPLDGVNYDSYIVRDERYAVVQVYINAYSEYVITKTI